MNFNNSIDLTANSKYETTKQNPDINDYFKAFTGIKIYNHQIDNIKGQNRVQASDQLIKSTGLKLKNGSKLIEVILEERRDFFLLNKRLDIEVVKLIEDLHTISQMQDDHLHYRIKENLNLQMDLDRQFHISFQRINQIILILDEKYIYRQDWRSLLLMQKVNKDIQYMINLNLEDSAQILYDFFQEKQEELQQITQDQDAKDFTNQQTEKLLVFLLNFSEILADKIPLQIQILSQIYIDDLLVLQNLYQKNFSIYIQFFSNFSSQFYGVILFFEKANLNLESLKSDNQDVLRVIQMIQMPQNIPNQNTVYQIHLESKIKKIMVTLDKLRKKIDQLYQTPINITFYKIDSFDKDSTEPTILIPLDSRILEQFMIEQAKLITEKLDDIELVNESLDRLSHKLKILLLCDKKLRKAQVNYLNLASALQQSRSTLSLVQDIAILDTTSDRDILVLQKQGKLLWGFQNLLQKNINILQFYLQVAKDLSKILPLIGDFINQVEKFIMKADLLEDQCILAGTIKYREINLIIEKMRYYMIIMNSIRKAGRFKEVPKDILPPQPMPIDSDEEFHGLLSQQFNFM